MPPYMPRSTNIVKGKAAVSCTDATDPTRSEHVKSLTNKTGPNSGEQTFVIGSHDRKQSDCNGNVEDLNS